MNEGTSSKTVADNLPHPVERSGVDPPDPDGIAIITNYTGAAAQASKSIHGPFPARYEVEDIIQTVHVYLHERLGNGYTYQIAQAVQCDDVDGFVHRQLRASVTQAIGDCRWTEDKRKQRGRKQVPLTDADMSHDDSAGRDLAIDLTEAMLCLSPLERRVLELKKAGYTGEEIAQCIPLRDKQEVSEVFCKASCKIRESRKGLK